VGRVADPDGMRCVPVVDDDGQVVASVRMSGEMDDRARRAWLDVVAAVHRMDAELDAADPGRAEWQAAAVARIRERNRRWRGGESG
jgi:aminoglycoside phosphotransferase (APT) family kinase protein